MCMQVLCVGVSTLICTRVHNVNHWGASLCSQCRAVATSQVLRYLPDHFFSKLPERLPVLIIQKWAEPVAIEFDDRTSQLDCKCLTFTLQNAPETLSGGLKIQNFPGGACLQTPLAHVRCACVMQMPCPHWPLILYLTTQNFRGYGPAVILVLLTTCMWKRWFA